MLLFFFSSRRRHTRSTRDWSSDVCSSDLLPGIELDGVCYLRSLAETDELRQRLNAAERVVVIGAGFIGLEFAAVAHAQGKQVHIVELTDRVMGRVVSV